MTVLGRGDLSPPRRHRRRAGPALLVGAGVLAVVLGAWLGWRAVHRSGHPSRAAVRVCVTPRSEPAPASPSAVTVDVVNATPRDGLAHGVAAQLRARGFRIGRVGNTHTAVPGVATVSYPPGSITAARAVADQVPGATVVPAAGGAVTLSLGPRFRALATPAEAAASRARELQAASPRPPSCSGS